MLLNSIKLNCRVLYKNKLVENIYEACTCCYDNTKSINYLEKKEYIEKRISAGHESILEHGKLAILFNDIPHSMYSSIIELMGLEYSKWLEFYTVELENGDYNLIVNGSIRAYKHFLNNLEGNVYDRNLIILNICKVLTENTVKELYGENKYLKFDFIDVEPDVSDIEKNKIGISYDVVLKKPIDNMTTNGEPNIKKVDMGIDELISKERDIQDVIYKTGFNDTVLLNIIPVTIVFYNMSRTATHQLVRHRNAITQESQRYVNYKNATFTIPIPNYNDDKEYTIDVFGNKITVPLTVLATGLTKVYDQLIKQGLKKEEARAFLPANINCGRLYMTFTLSNLLAFLKLRTDSHAQSEIREYANTILDLLTSIPDYINLTNVINK
jgi:flavin-dependent thymidylate synthase